MIKLLLISPLKKYFIIVAAILLTVVALPANSSAGSGTFKNGVYDFCVSVRFNATEAELDQIRQVFIEANRIFADATDGQQRFGNIKIINNSGGSQIAEYWIHQNPDGAYATQGKYGVRGEHVNLYFPSNIQGDLLGNAYTIAHEHAHHSFGVLDEYSGRGLPCRPPIPPSFTNCAFCADASANSPTLNYCLMDQYYIRGGRQFGGSYTLNEFCVTGNHDPDGNSFQRDACWQTIANHPKRAITPPTGLPTDTPPIVTDCTLSNGVGALRVMLLLDRSGSMTTDQRLVFAKLGGNLFTDFTPNSVGLGISSFADSGSVNFPLTQITGSGTRSAAKAAINSLNANGSTNIGGGLLSALGQFTTQPDRSCNEVIVLLSDGDHNVGTPPASVIGQLQDAGVTVLTVGVGSGISSSGEATLQNIANQTGGKYYRVSGAFSLVGVFLRLVMESIGNGLLRNEAISQNSFQATEIPIYIEAGASNATFAVTFADSSDNISMSLRTPSGVIITEEDAGTNPNIQFISGPNSKAFQIGVPEAGTWTMIINTGTVNTGQIEVFAFADHDGVQLNASVTDDSVTSTETINIQATPTFTGQRVICSTTSLDGLFDSDRLTSISKGNNVTCPTVTGIVNRPDGSSVPITLYDDGEAVHGDIEANDGVYSASFNSYQGDGTYTFNLTAIVSDAITYPGESLFQSGPLTPNPVPNFIRSASTTAVVTGTTAVPSITGVNPNQGNRGQTLNISITGDNTNFVNGTTSVEFSGAGITVNSTSVSSSTSLVVSITIAPNAVLSARDITVMTGSEVVTASSTFQVVNSPPICSVARPSVALITPPDRRFVPISILGVTDPDNDTVTIGVTTVRQDEPVDHIGDGSFVPDSTLGSSTALLRAESIIGTVVVGGTPYVGNGRVYHVSFTATDPSNASCSGTVKVGVPHIRTATPIDGGALFNSITAQSARFSDFDGDRKTDLSFFREGEWHIKNTSNELAGVINFGLPGDRIVPADYDGNGKTDVAVYRNGNWWILGTNNTTTVRQFGLDGDLPVPADYDGDGKDDLAVYRQGIWHLMQSSAGYAAISFGLAADNPVPADYDGDGRTDIAVYRNGVWYLLRSAQGFLAFQFGLAGDKPVPSDYDGDGKADAAVYRNGVWYLLRSAQGVAILQFGLGTDIPTPADYDGDGKSDISVYREGVWYSLNTSNGQYRVVQFGTSNDRPIPSAFVP